jgi:hypothetical protein
LDLVSMTEGWPCAACAPCGPPCCRSWPAPRRSHRGGSRGKLTWLVLLMNRSVRRSPVLTTGWAVPVFGRAGCVRHAAASGKGGSAGVPPPGSSSGGGSSSSYINRPSGPQRPPGNSRRQMATISASIASASFSGAVRSHSPWASESAASASSRTEAKRPSSSRPRQRHAGPAPSSVPSGCGFDGA